MPSTRSGDLCRPSLGLADCPSEPLPLSVLGPKGSRYSSVALAANFHWESFHLHTVRDRMKFM